MGNRTAKVFRASVLVGCLLLVTAERGQPVARADQGPVQRSRITASNNGIASSTTDHRIIAKHSRAKAISSVATSASGGVAGVTNDLCANQESIEGPGTFAFDNTNATKDGPNNTACLDPGVDPVGTIDKDVWYCWRATCTGPVEIETCGLTSVDTKIAVYDGCTCPVTEARIKQCNDDASGCGLQSSVTFAAVSGQSYMLRLGVYPGNGGGGPSPGGTGQFRIACVDLPCAAPVGHCQDVDVDNANTSDRNNFIAADNFTPAVSGTVNQICWWGSYELNAPSPDTFEIRYYSSAGAYPGALLAGPFVQSAGTLTVSGPVDTAAGADFPVFEYSATHAPVPVTAGDCYWVEITNAVDDSQIWYWHWGTGGDGTSRSDGPFPFNGYGPGDEQNSDLAFCLNLYLGDATICPPPASAACTGAMGGCCGGLTTPACGDQGCCNRVCTCDSFCCRIAWDDMCAGVGGIPGCGAALLCGSVCTAPFDADYDEDVDLDDVTFLVNCLNGPDELTPQECLRAFDFDEDGDVDLVDLAAFMNAFGG